MLGIYPEKMKTQKDMCTPVSTAALYRIVKTWKEPRHPLTDEWRYIYIYIYIYNVYYIHIYYTYIINTYIITYIIIYITILLNHKKE